MNEEKLVIIILVLSSIVVIGLVPFATIWSINTVFGLEIAYNLKNWVAIAWLITVFHGAKYAGDNRSS